MLTYFNALTDPNMVFLRYALFAGLLAAPAFGIIGTYVVARRMTYLAGAIAHCVLGGIGAALYCQARYELTWLTPMLGAIVAAIGAALLIGLISLRSRERVDSVIGAIWVLGMATGIIFIAKTPGYIDPMSYLFGNILMITGRDLLTIAVLDVIVIGLGLLSYNRMIAVCFDEEFARLRGIRTELYTLLLLCLTALTIVLMVRVVGIVMVIALFTLPAATASHFSTRIWQMMLFATLLGMISVAGGLSLSYGLDLPSGPTIVMLAGFFYLTVIIGKGLKSKLR
ncbi:MAG: metal ABC transporter permease [Desulfocapsaceae bacterium]|nr:metal ABC transporter permease [Desulfocapsaceae bacterium]